MTQSHIRHRFRIRLVSLLVAEIFFCSLFSPPAFSLERSASLPDRSFLRQPPARRGGVLEEIRKGAFSKDESERTHVFKRVLLVDNRHLILAAVLDYLTQMMPEAELALARSHTKAMEKLKSAQKAGEPFDLVVTDLKMGSDILTMPVEEKEGGKLIREIRGTSSLTQPRIVVLAAGASRDEAKLLEIGADEVVDKDRPTVDDPRRDQPSGFTERLWVAITRLRAEDGGKKTSSWPERVRALGIQQRNARIVSDISDSMRIKRFPESPILSQFNPRRKERLVLLEKGKDPLADENRPKGQRILLWQGKNEKNRLYKIGMQITPIVPDHITIWTEKEEMQDFTRGHAVDFFDLTQDFEGFVIIFNDRDAGASNFLRLHVQGYPHPIPFPSDKDPGGRMEVSLPILTSAIDPNALVLRQNVRVSQLADYLIPVLVIEGDREGSVRELDRVIDVLKEENLSFNLLGQKVGQGISRIFVVPRTTGTYQGKGIASFEVGGFFVWEKEEDFDRYQGIELEGILKQVTPAKESEQWLRTLEKIRIDSFARDGSTKRTLPLEEALRKPFKLIITDLDDSLLLGRPPEGVKAFEPETKILFSELRAQEMNISAITGRSLPGVTERYIRELSFPERAGQFVFVAGGGRGFQFDAEGHFDEQTPVFVKLLLEDPAVLNRLLQKVARIAVQIVEDSGHSRDLVFTHFEQGHSEDPVKVTVDMPDAPQELRNQVADALNQHLTRSAAYEGIHAYATSLAVEVTRADKGDAVRYIAESLGIPEETILLIGDSAIDGPMYAALERATKLHLGDSFPGMPGDVIVSPIPNTAGIRAAMAIVLEARARGRRVDAATALHLLRSPSVVVTFDNPEIEYAFGHMSDLQRQMAVTSDAWEVREMAEGQVRVSLSQSPPEGAGSEGQVKEFSRILDVQEALYQFRIGAVKPSPRWRRGLPRMSLNDIEKAIIEGALQVIERKPGHFFLSRPPLLPYGVLTPEQTLTAWKKPLIQKTSSVSANIEQMKPEDVEKGIRQGRIRAMRVAPNRIFLYPSQQATMGGVDKPMPESSEDGGAKRDTLINDLWRSIRTQNEKRLEKLLERLRHRADTWVWTIAAKDNTPLGEIPEQIKPLAMGLGLEQERAEDLALVSSELIGDIIFHTEGGVFIFRKIRREGRPALEMLALDRGPGIPGGEKILKKELNPDLLVTTGRGFFILNAMQESGQLDDIRIDSIVEGTHPDPGTKVSILKWLEDAPKETVKDGGQVTTPFRLKDYFYQGRAAVLNGSI